MSPPHTLVVFGLLAAFAGCSGQGATAPVDAASSTCGADSRAMSYAAGMQLASATKIFEVKLVSSTPGPPIKGNNDWVISVTDAGGKPVLGATITATPFMPDHGHGTPIKVSVTELSGGQYKLSPVNLFMSGLWQVAIDITSVGGEADLGGPSDQVIFAFCVEG